jgi:hypothetical protein
MITWQEFKIDSIQTVIFTPDRTEFSAPKAIAAVFAHFSEIYNGNMQVMPIPMGAPGEIPHVILQSAERDNGQHSLSMAPLRTESSWRRHPDGPPADAEEAFDCAKVLEQYVDATHVNVSRVALIISRFCPNPNPALTLIQTFCKEETRQGPFSRSESFEIHNHKIYLPQGAEFRINSWVRCKSATMTKDNSPIVAVEQDLNTLGNEIRRFDSQKIHSFFQTAVTEAEQIFRKYFPK